MRIGIGLPNAIPGVPGRTLVEWARRAEDLGFAGLSTIDRIAYPNHDALTALAAAAAVTNRIELFADLMLDSAYPAGTTGEDGRHGRPDRADPAHVGPDPRQSPGRPRGPGS
ncbi:LLM class flavin-dependent oxidoreductase [Asanoa siamensis]|uniref:LLM class flavin-dependent oxidoreductase n=1 Tax=Asanoa siamensis TaxID=926357 RepID=UPI0019428F6B|nr:LLM class flavin-dependent oxidoreductase [Asanoa siamensis]